MKIAPAQMRMTGNVQENLEKSLKFCDLAEDCDLLFFPEIQLSPFFFRNVKSRMLKCMSWKKTGRRSRNLPVKQKNISITFRRMSI